MKWKWTESATPGALVGLALAVVGPVGFEVVHRAQNGRRVYRVQCVLDDDGGTVGDGATREWAFSIAVPDFAPPSFVHPGTSLGTLEAGIHNALTASVEATGGTFASAIDATGVVRVGASADADLAAWREPMAAWAVQRPCASGWRCCPESGTIDAGVHLPSRIALRSSDRAPAWCHPAVGSRIVGDAGPGPGLQVKVVAVVTVTLGGAERDLVDEFVVARRSLGQHAAAALGVAPHPVCHRVGAPPAPVELLTLALDARHPAQDVPVSLETPTFKVTLRVARASRRWRLLRCGPHETSSVQLPRRCVMSSASSRPRACVWTTSTAASLCRCG